MSPSKKGQRPTTAKAKGGAKGKGGPSREQIRRLGLLVFGAIFLVLFVGLAIAEGVGDPSIPDGSIAVVQGIPAGAEKPFDKPAENCKGEKVAQDLSKVTEAEFECAFKQVVAASGAKKAPKPGDKQYGELKETTTNSLLETIWIQGLAAEEGFTVTEKEVEEELEKLKKQNFKTEAEFTKFLKTSHYTTQDVNERVKIQILSTEIQKKLGENPPKPSKDEIKEFYEEAKSTQFTTPPTRDIRVLIAKDEKKAAAAKAALDKDDSAKAWTAAINKYADSKTAAKTGGLQEKVSEEQFTGEVGEKMFEAPVGKVEGPVKYSTVGNVVFEVEKLNPEKVQPLGEAESQIEAQLKQQSQEAIFSKFVSGFQGLWRSRTFCADDYAVEKCANFKSDGRSAEADPACFEANPKKAPEACPAAVNQLKPARPGSVSVITPKGEALAQRPRPAGLEEAAEGVPSFSGGLPPGVTTGAPPTSP